MVQQLGVSMPSVLASVPAQLCSAEIPTSSPSFFWHSHASPQGAGRELILSKHWNLEVCPQPKQVVKEAKAHRVHIGTHNTGQSLALCCWQLTAVCRAKLAQSHCVLCACLKALGIVSLWKICRMSCLKLLFNPAGYREVENFTCKTWKLGRLWKQKDFKTTVP